MFIPFFLLRQIHGRDFFPCTVCQDKYGKLPEFRNNVRGSKLRTLASTCVPGAEFFLFTPALLIIRYTPAPAQLVTCTNKIK